VFVLPQYKRNWNRPGFITSECSVAREVSKLKISIIADGGIKSAGDVAKQLHLGGCRNAWKECFPVQKKLPVKVIKYSGGLWKKIPRFRIIRS